MILIVVGSLGLLERAPVLNGNNRPVALMAAILGLFLVAGYEALRSAQQAVNERTSTVSQLAQIAKQHAGGKRIAFLATSLYPGFPVVNYSGASWGYRFDSLWLLATLYAPASTPGAPVSYHNLDAMSETERYLFEAVIQDLTQSAPAVIVVDARPNIAAFNDASFDYIQYFSQDDQFAKLWIAYEFLAEVNGYRVFRLMTK
jgi:hypothetical protein